MTDWGKMKKSTQFLIGAAASIGLVMTPVIAFANEYPAFSATCSDAGNSSFVATKRGFYTYVWRTGSTTNGGGIVYLRAGQAFEIDSPDAVEAGQTRFGVLTTSRTFAYITCGA